MFMVFKKKQMIIGTLVVMLGVAGYLNYRYDTGPDSEKKKISQNTGAEPDIGETVMVSGNNVKESDNPFYEEKLKIANSRDKAKEELNALLETEGISQEIKEETVKKLADITAYREAEAAAEELLKAKGYPHTMVYISEDGVTVSVKKKGLNQKDMAKIVDVVFELTQNNNIKIVEVE